MALTYAESFALMTDLPFRGRITTACLKYAQYISLESPQTPAHNTKLKWASQTYSNPTLSAQQVQPPVVLDPAVQAEGANVTDEELQGIVEDTVNMII